jgi:prepilin-type N-terminal cleavage/methylation domain-containing protein/prepilin-type processing-associated H-X9-DG protein
MKTCKKNSKAFTLVELLVVIAIIALLLSILMPALSKVRSQARNVICVSNVRQISLAGKLWTEDNDGWVLPALWDRDYNGNKVLATYLGSPETGDKVMLCPTVPKKYAGKTFGELNLTNDVAGFATAGNFYNSYGYNFKLCANTLVCPGSFDSSNNDGTQWGRANVWYITHGNCKLQSIRKPSTTILFADTIMYISYPEFLTKGMVNPSFNDPSERGRRHSPTKRGVGSNKTEMCGWMNIAWADGSVSKEPKDIDARSANGRGYDINAKYWYGN